MLACLLRGIPTLVEIAFDAGVSDACLQWLKRGTHEPIIDNCAHILTCVAQLSITKRNILINIGIPDAIHHLLLSRAMHEYAVASLLLLASALIEGKPEPSLITL